jgi:2-dehydropantoate 2-reductase
MGEIRRVMILGAGAVGSYYATQFYNQAIFTTSLIAKGSRARRLVDEGLVVNGRQYFIPVVRPDQHVEKADLIIGVVKQHHLEQAIPDLANFIGKQTIILSMMNGLDSEAYIGSIYGPEQVMYGLAVGIDALRDKNNIVFTKPGKHFFGEAENSKLSERVKRVQEAFSRAQIDFETPVDMLRVLWWKFMVNVGMNAPSAVMAAPYGVFQSSKEAQSLMEALMREAVQVAQLEGINLGEADISEWYTFLNALSPDGKTSMLQDVEAGRKTEMEIFGGKVVELGQKHGIATPVNETLVWIIRVLEARKQAAFG